MTADDLLFRHNPDPAWIYDRETLAFLAVNPAAIATYEYSEAEFLGMTIGDIRPPEDLARLRAHVDEHQDLHDAGYWQHRWKSGELRTVEIRASPLTYRGRAADLVAIRDVTEDLRLASMSREALKAEVEAAALLATAGRLARFGAWVAELDTGRIVWSEGTALIHEELPGTSPSLETGLDYYVPEHRPLIASAFELCASKGEPFDLTLQIVTARGRPCWIRAVGEPVRNATGKIVEVRGAFQDVDEVLRARERLAASERRLSDVLDCINEGFVVLAPDWTLTFVNKAAGRLVSRDPLEIVGMTIWAAFPETVGSPFQRNYEQARATQRPILFEEYFEPLKTWFEVRAYPSGDGLAVHFQDVTARRAALNDLLTSEERFRLISEVTNDVIWDWHFDTDAIWFSESFSTRFCHDLADACSGAFWSSHIHSDDRARVLERLDRHLTGGSREWSDEYRFEKAGGGQARIIDRGVIIRDPSGRPRRMLGTMMDVTDRVSMEAQLRESQKLEAMGQLTGGVAHDFNNLLTVIMGAVESLEDVVADDALIRSLTGEIGTAASRGADLTGHMLAFARRQPLEPQVTDIGRTLTGLKRMLGRTLSEDIDVTVICEPDDWNAIVDSAQLDTALLNLAINARDAMPSGGRLTIEMTNASLDQDYADQHPDVLPGDYVAICVSDTGTGMDPETASRAFEPFFTTKEVGAGSGLGLSMVYGFAKQSCGHVRIYSEPGVGTSVRLYLPRAAGGDHVHVAPSAPGGLPRGSERILVVEDDAMVREHVARHLSALGYDVTLAMNGVEALRILRSGEWFDLLFTDVVMPGGINGRELAEASVRLVPDLRILFTSGYTENAIVHHGRLDPGVQLLSKPYRRAELAAKVRDVLDDRTGSSNAPAS